MRFTAANARENAAKSHVVRHLNYLAAKQARKAQSLQLPSTPVVAAETPTLDDFSRLRLSRVRAQLDRLDKMISQETDAQRLDRLASASAKISEVERQLSNRPLPGSLRPTETKRASIFSRPRPAAEMPLQPAKFEQE